MNRDIIYDIDLSMRSANAIKHIWFTEQDNHEQHKHKIILIDDYLSDERAYSALIHLIKLPYPTSLCTNNGNYTRVTSCHLLTRKLVIRKCNIIIQNYTEGSWLCLLLYVLNLPLCKARHNRNTMINGSLINYYRRVRQPAARSKSNIQYNLIGKQSSRKAKSNW